MKLGKAFSDSVSKEETVHVRREHDGDSWWIGTGRALMFATVLFVALFILMWRLFDLTIIQGRQFRVLADNNRTRELIIHAPRGLLLDRTGKSLVANIPEYRLLQPCDKSGAQECTLVVSKEEGDRLEKSGLPAGNFLEVDYRRQYIYDSLSQVTGYTGELSPAELKDDYYQLRLYHAGDRIGRAGAEAVYEDKLRGQDGKELVEIDAGGKILRVLGVQEAIPGEDMTLSVDANLSEVAKKAFPPGEKGAIVISKPSTGEIFALYSSPSFSANSFSQGMSQSAYTALVNSPDQPMLDRAIAGTYPPGSTFKIILSIAALQERAIKPDTTVIDDGTITIGPFSFSNWYFTQYGKVEGVVDIVKALRRSNDIFFYKVGELLGITKIAKWGHILGLGKPLGIELPGEATGIMPDPTWKAGQFTSAADLAARNNQWYLGDTYHVAIGQGYLLVTPLQVNAWTNVIASGGKLCRPTIRKTQTGLVGIQKPNCIDLGISNETLSLVARGLEEACAPGGTGWPLFDYGIKKNAQGVATASGTLTSIPVACKTGTAEFGDPRDRTHAWFTTYAPVPKEDIGVVPYNATLDTTSPIASNGARLAPVLSGDPELSITVLVEGAGEGSNVAAPVAKQIYDEWFSR